MKKYAVIFLFLSAVFSAAARESAAVKPAEITDEEIKGMMELLGVHGYRFDLSAFSGKEYRFTAFVDEYAAGEKPNERWRFIVRSNWRPRYTDAEEWKKFLDESAPKLSEDGQKYLSFENMGIYILPRDSTATVKFNFYGEASANSLLTLKTHEKSRRGPLYGIRPFKIYPSAEKQQRIPLLLYNAFWWDEQSGLFRSCMESEMEPDLSNESLKLLPHYYVIGIEVEEIEPAGN